MAADRWRIINELSKNEKEEQRLKIQLASLIRVKVKFRSNNEIASIESGLKNRAISFFWKLIFNEF